MSTITTGRTLCPFCEATPAGCQSIQTLSGRCCCQRCTGDHHNSHTTTKASH